MMTTIADVTAVGLSTRQRWRTGGWFW